MLLTLHTSDDELRTIMCKYEDDPIFYPIWHSIKFELEQAFPNTKLNLYSCHIGSAELLIAYEKNRITDDFFVLYCNGVVSSEEFNGVLAELHRLHPWDQRTLFIGEEEITKAVSTYYTGNTSFISKPYPCRMFYMDRNQMDSVRDLQLPNLPFGYELGSADPDNDSQLITNTWRHAKVNEEEQTRAKLTCFPSSCIRYNGSAVGFEMIDSLGLFNHLFVLEQHRKKGFGNVIELDLAKKIIRKGLKVCKCVELFNTSVLAGSKRSPLWSTAKYKDGSDVTYVFMVVTKE